MSSDTSKTPLPRMSLRTRDKDSQKHPGKPDLPRPRRSTVEVQAEKAEKARVEAERERSRLESIRATAELETRMGEQLKEKLTTAHHPPPSKQKKASRVPARPLFASPEAAPKGKSFFQTRSIVEP